MSLLVHFFTLRPPPDIKWSLTWKSSSFAGGLAKGISSFRLTTSEEWRLGKHPSFPQRSVWFTEC